MNAAEISDNNLRILAKACMKGAGVTDVAILAGATLKLLDRIDKLIEQSQQLRNQIDRMNLNCEPRTTAQEPE